VRAQNPADLVFDSHSRPPAPEVTLPHAADLPSADRRLRAGRRLHHDQSSL